MPWVFSRLAPRCKRKPCETLSPMRGGIHLCFNASLLAHAMQPTTERLRGIASMVSAVFVFSIMDSLMKKLSSHYDPLQISCMRSLSSLLVICIPLAWQGTWSSLRATNPVLHVARGGLGVIMLVSFVYAVRQLSLAQTYSLFLAAPLVMTALSVPMFGDHIPRKRWLAIIAGLGGVLIILQPWSKGVMPVAAAVAAAVATLCYSLSALTVRSLGSRNSSMAMVFWYLVVVCIASAALGISVWQPIQHGDWIWISAIGFSGALGQYWLTDAFRRAPSSVVGPFEYTAILWAFGIDWIFWSAQPSAALIAGAAIVVASGIYVILDERRLAMAATAAVPPP